MLIVQYNEKKTPNIFVLVGHIVRQNKSFPDKIFVSDQLQFHLVGAPCRLEE